MSRKLSLFIDSWQMVEPFTTAKGTVTQIDTLTACIRQDGLCGKGEALGVDYAGETTQSMQEQAEWVRAEVEAGVDCKKLAEMLPAGGARNALDCALWDLKAKQSGQRVWQMLNTPANPVQSAYTLSLDSPRAMAREATRFQEFPLLKLKIGPEQTAATLSAIRKARPDARLVIDANESWSLDLLESLAGEFRKNRLEMIEQPLPAGQDRELSGLDYPITLCADESCHDSTDLGKCLDRYQMVNIKLDKCGGLTEAMNMVQWCRDHGLELMVGNMLGSSLAMAPGFIVAQYCRYVDLDGPLWQVNDRSTPMEYKGAELQPPSRKLWG
jgi:L-alanine-DL-glutamate epimerase-like enolase superfamily enzyme